MISHTVRYDDSIQVIGQAYKVDWRQIVSINGLEYPYIDTTPVDNPYEGNNTVAKVGTKLLIPSDNMTTPEISGEDDLAAYAYGADLDIWSVLESEQGTNNLDDHGKLDSESGDIKLAVGLNNLKQQIITRLGTPKGTLSLHPEYGCDVTLYSGRKTTVELLITQELAVTEAILQDSRIKSVKDVSVTFSGGSTRITAYIQPISPYDAFELSYDYTAVNS